MDTGVKKFMKIIQAKGIIKDGEVRATLPEQCSNSEVDIIVLAKDEPDEFEQRHQLMLAKGYNNRDKVMQLIRQIKLEMLKEKGRS